MNVQHINKVIYTNIIMTLKKDMNLYIFFRASLGITPLSGKNGVSSLYWDFLPSDFHSNTGNRFANVYNYDQFWGMMELLLGKMLQGTKTSDERIQFYVMECINFVLKNLVEPYFLINKRQSMHDIKKDTQELMEKIGKRMEKIGQEIFDSTCRCLFGNDFEDKTTKSLPIDKETMRAAMKSIKSIKEVLPHELVFAQMLNSSINSWDYYYD